MSEEQFEKARDIEAYRIAAPYLRGMISRGTADDMCREMAGWARAWEMKRSEKLVEALKDTFELKNQCLVLISELSNFIEKEAHHLTVPSTALKQNRDIREKVDKFFKEAKDFFLSDKLDKYQGNCICGEINARNCPVHQSDSGGDE